MNAQLNGQFRFSKNNDKIDKVYQNQITCHISNDESILLGKFQVCAHSSVSLKKGQKQTLTYLC